MKKGRLVVISGPSGAGKGTVTKGVLGDLDNTKMSVSMTTRKPREGEVNGVHYYFVSDAEFQQCIQENGFLEYAKVYENYYGTPKVLVTQRLAEGMNVMLEIDVQGAMQIKKSYPSALFVFILPPSMQELRRRIEQRGTEDAETIELRMNEAIDEIDMATEYDHIIVNDDLDKAIDQLASLIREDKEETEDKKAEIIRRFKEEN